MPTDLRYLLLDVFTDTPFEGNQLAVFPAAHGLTGEQMQALARETNLSETTFCLPGTPEENREGIPVRIFTPQEELPFAGHPTLGTATALRWLLPGLHGSQEVLLRLKVGTVPVRFSDGSAGASGHLPFGASAQGEMQQPLPTLGQRHDPSVVAHALGLPLEAIDPSMPIQTASTGLPFAIVPLVSVQALGGLQLSPREAEACLDGTDAKFFYAIAPDSVDGTAWRARMQFYGGEDPATGSAAGAATAYLVANGFAPQETPLHIRQGIEMRRPSLIRTSASLQKQNAAVSEKCTPQDWCKGSYVRVGGSTVLVAEGRFFLP